MAHELSSETPANGVRLFARTTDGKARKILHFIGRERPRREGPGEDGHRGPAPRKPLSLQLGGEIRVVRNQFGDGPVVVPAGDPIPEGFTCLGRQRVARGCPRSIPKFATLTSQLAGTRHDCLQLRVEFHPRCHAGKGTGQTTPRSWHCWARFRLTQPRMPGVGAVRVSVQASPREAPSWLALATEVERAGFDGLYVGDHPGSGPAPFVALAAAAAVTERLRLGTCVLNAAVWDPVQLAGEVSTLDGCPGGAVLGIGAGHTPQEWTSTGRGVPSPAERVDRMVELIDATYALWPVIRCRVGGTTSRWSMRSSPTHVPSRNGCRSSSAATASRS